MPKPNEFESSKSTARDLTIVKSENQQSKSEPETYLTETNIRLLKRMFKDEDVYIHHMDTLWVLRELSRSACRIPNVRDERYDHDSPYFRFYMLTNDLIGALLNSWVHFSMDNGKMSHYINHNRPKD